MIKNVSFHLYLSIYLVLILSKCQETRHSQFYLQKLLNRFLHLSILLLFHQWLLCYIRQSTLSLDSSNTKPI